MILYTHYLQSHFIIFLFLQAFTILKDINILVKKVQKISKMRQEVTSLKKAVGDTVEFLESNRSLIIDFCSMVSARYILKRPPKMYFPTHIVLGDYITMVPTMVIKCR